MALFDSTALNDGVAPREVAVWSMYDFANSGYTTVVLTAVFNAYFVSAVAGGADWATLAWTASLSFSALLVMLTAPAIGTWADVHNRKKRLLGICTVGCVIATAGLYFAQPGTVVLAVALVVISNFFFSMGDNLNAAFLPELAKPESMGKVSGWGWSFGYFGGMLTLGLSLAWVINAQANDVPATQFVPATMLITAGIFAIAALPMFLVLRERGNIAAARANDIKPSFVVVLLGSFSQLRTNWRESRKFDDFYRLLYCAVSYQAGISVVIALAAIYAQEVVGFTQTETMALVFLVNITAALGAFGFGYLQDAIGHRRALSLTLIGWIIMILLAGFGQSIGMFWASATMAGLCMGSAQTGGRAIAGLLAPKDRMAEFYGLWAFATRLAAVIGPITYGLVTWGTSGNHRIAILSTGLFFVIGLILLAKIDVERGRQIAIDAGATPE